MPGVRAIVRGRARIGVASLRHPAIVPIHDYWREPGAAYVVMRRMHGGTLADRLRRGPLTNAALATLVGRIGGALAAAAEQGIVHGRVGRRQRAVRRRSARPTSATSRSVLDRTRPPPTTSTTSPCSCERCLGERRGPVADVLAGGLATVGRPAIGEFVPAARRRAHRRRDRCRRSPAEPVQGPAGVRRGGRRRLLRPHRRRRRAPRPTPVRRPAGPARTRRRRVGDGQVERRAGRTAAAGPRAASCRARSSGS